MPLCPPRFVRCELCFCYSRQGNFLFLIVAVGFTEDTPGNISFKMKMPKSMGSGMTVYFDQYNPNSDQGTDVRKSLAHLDYSPLPRVTGRTFAMAMLVSMGGLM